MEKLHAGDIMIPMDQYPHIPYWFSLRQAMAAMEGAQLERNGQKTLPRVVLVFNEKYELLGMVRRRDILLGLEPEFLTQQHRNYRSKLFDVRVDPNLSELSFDKILSGIRERAERSVKDIMTPIKATVDYDDHIIKVIYEMTQYDLSILPVMKDGNVAGVVRTVDVFHEIAKHVL